MAKSIEFVQQSPKNYIDSASRYNKSRLVYWGDKKILTFETYKRTPIKSSDDDRYYVITAGSQYRPDLVARKAYGDEGLWWRILEANKMKDIWDFKVGTNIVIPGTI